MPRIVFRNFLKRRPQRRTALPRIVKKTDGVDYIADLLSRIDLKVVRMHEVDQAQEPSLYLRHDVDRDMVRALDIARVEQAHGYVSTFFLLTPGSYDHKPTYYGRLKDGIIEHDAELIDNCRRLIDFGHDIGFHNDLVALSLTTGRSPRDLLEAELEFFDRHDIPMRGMAAHGSPLARQLMYNNRELFKGQHRRKWVVGRTITYNGNTVQLHELDMQEFGFAYEAYALPRDSRFSESGGRWAGRVAGERPPTEDWCKHMDLEAFRAYVSRASAAHDVKFMSLLTHPCHWNAR